MKSLRALPALLLPLLCWVDPALAQGVRTVDTSMPRADLSPALSALASQTSKTAPPASNRIFPLHLLPNQMKDRARTAPVARAAAPYSALQSTRPAPPLAHVNTGGTVLNFEGIDSNGTVAPADPNGAVGEYHYVQAVNVQLAVYDKTNGDRLLGPIPFNTVFNGLVGDPGADACRESNVGDPIVQYDKLAKRWMLTQIGSGGGMFYQCIALSTSSDPLGSYYRYVLPVRGQAGQSYLNDYPKVGVWPDAYYFTFVLFDAVTLDFVGPRACGLDRAKMLAGASSINVRCADLGTAYGVLLPSDLDGTTAPPAGSPNYLLSLDYDASGNGESLFMWRLSFTNSTISGPIEIPVAPFTIACPGQGGGACVRQPAPGELLDALGDRLMHRLAYRNFGDRETLVTNHSVQQPGAPTDGPVGVRWYEIRNPGGAVGVYQQGTFAPDSNSRWMGSIAMDRMGNIALGYSISGEATPPGVRYTGRMRSEPLGRMELEDIIMNGGGVQVNTSNRWGDYSAMTVDPVKDCAFWYTQQYMATTGSFNWATRIADFKFGNCK